VCGFLSELQGLQYDRQLFDDIVSVFNVFPLAAVINDEILCVHGGIGPNFKSLEEIEKIPRVVGELYGGIADSILWSDPSTDVDEYERSPRGNGFIYGKSALEDFLKANSLKLLVRGHQSIPEGVKFGLDNLVVTVFSASSYCNQMANPAGVLIVAPDEPTVHVLMDPLPYLTRANIKYKGETVVAQAAAVPQPPNPRRLTPVVRLTQGRRSLRAAIAPMNLSPSPRGVS
jgi:protein phosphatase